MNLPRLNSTLLKSAAVAVSLLYTATAFAGVREDLQSLYPNFSNAQVEQKIQASTDAFMFMRSFIPYYYLLIKQDASVASGTIGLKPLTGDAGWCAGDAHPENFGALIDASGLAVFAINDVDDSGPCPLYADALRFFTAVKINDSGADLSPVIAAYKQGLSGSDITTSQAVSDLLGNARAAGASADQKEISNIEDLKKSHNMAEPIALSPNEANQIGVALSSAYAEDVSVISGIKTQKLDGGSYGLTRYRVVVSIESFATPQVVELKQEVQPGIFPIATSAIPATADRIPQTLRLEQGDPSNFYSVRNIPGVGDLLVRPLFAGNIGISMSDYKPSELSALLVDEARALGNFHRKSASQHYLSTAQTIDANAWSNGAQQIAAVLTKTYQSVKK